MGTLLPSQTRLILRALSAAVQLGEGIRALPCTPETNRLWGLAAEAAVFGKIAQDTLLGVALAEVVVEPATGPALAIVPAQPASEQETA